MTWNSVYRSLNIPKLLDAGFAQLCGTPFRSRCWAVQWMIPLCGPPTSEPYTNIRGIFFLWDFLMTRSKWQLHVPFPYFSSRIADSSGDQSQYSRAVRLRNEVSSQSLLCWYSLLPLVPYISHTWGGGSLPCFVSSAAQTSALGCD